MWPKLKANGWRWWCSVRRRYISSPGIAGCTGRPGGWRPSSPHRAEPALPGVGRAGPVAQFGLAGVEALWGPAGGGLAATLWLPGAGSGGVDPQRFRGTCYRAAGNGWSPPRAQDQRPLPPVCPVPTSQLLSLWECFRERLERLPPRLFDLKYHEIVVA